MYNRCLLVCNDDAIIGDVIIGDVIECGDVVKGDVIIGDIITQVARFSENTVMKMSPSMHSTVSPAFLSEFRALICGEVEHGGRCVCNSYWVYD